MTIETYEMVRTKMYDTVSKFRTVSNIKLTDDTLIGDLGIDSLDIMEIIFQIEDEYGVPIDEDQLADMTSLGEIVELAVSTIKAKA